MLWLVRATLAHEEGDAEHDDRHNADADVGSEHHKGQLEWCLGRLAYEADLIAVEVEDCVVVSEEGITENPKVLLAEGQHIDVANLTFAGCVIVVRNFVGVRLRKGDLQRWERRIELLLVRALTHVATVHFVVGAAVVMNCLEHINHAVEVASWQAQVTGAAIKDCLLGRRDDEDVADSCLAHLQRPVGRVSHRVPSQR